MAFAHDTNDALRGAAALVNTVGAHPDSDGDTLTTTEQLEAFLGEWAWTGRVDGDERELGPGDRCTFELRPATPQQAHR